MVVEQIKPVNYVHGKSRLSDIMPNGTLNTVFPGQIGVIQSRFNLLLSDFSIPAIGGKFVCGSGDFAGE